MYVKEIRFGDTSVAYQPAFVDPDSAASPLEIVLDTGAASLTVRVAGSEGQPIVSGVVNLFPADAANEADFVDRAVFTFIDEQGVARFPLGLAPGIYLVLPTATILDLSPQSIAVVWQRRNDAARVKLPPGEAVDFRLEWDGRRE